MAFLIGLVIGNGVFVAGHFALGYLVGRSATELIAAAGGLAFIAVGVALAAIGLVTWTVIRRARGGAVAGVPLGDWADAACPACLAIAVLSPRIEPSAVVGAPPTDR